MADIVTNLVARVTVSAIVGAVVASGVIYYNRGEATQARQLQLMDQITAIESRIDQDGQTVREIYRREWPGLMNAEKVYAGLEVLTQHQWVRIEQRETGGRPSEVLSIHPKIRRAA